MPSKSDVAAFYRSPEWARLAYQAKIAHGRRCMCCGATPEDGARIVTDHVEPIRKAWRRRLDPSNLQILCDRCNRGKGSARRDDFRRPASTELAWAAVAAIEDDETMREGGMGVSPELEPGARKAMAVLIYADFHAWRRLEADFRSIPEWACLDALRALRRSDGDAWRRLMAELRQRATGGRA